MKRYLYYGCLVIGIMFLTGCSTETLTCSTDSTIDDNTITYKEYNIKFKNNIVNNIEMNIDVTLNDVDEVTEANLTNSVNDFFDEYIDMNGVDYSYNDTNNGFSVSVIFDFDRISLEDKNSISIINHQNSYDEIKADLENNGFSCR